MGSSGTLVVPFALAALIILGLLYLFFGRGHGTTAGTTSRPGALVLYIVAVAICVAAFLLVVRHVVSPAWLSAPLDLFVGESTLRSFPCCPCNQQLPSPFLFFFCSCLSCACVHRVGYLSAKHGTPFLVHLLYLPALGGCGRHHCSACVGRVLGVPRRLPSPSSSRVLPAACLPGGSLRVGALPADGLPSRPPELHP